MSLKAKIEAVIYASEEPVTLAQLIGLLGHEAQAEMDRAADAQQTLALDDSIAADPTHDEKGVAAVEPGLVEDSGSVDDPGYPRFDSSSVAPGVTPSTELTSDAAREEKARAARLRGFFRAALDELVAEYTSPDRGLEIREVAGGFRFATKPEYHDAVRGFVKSLKPPLKLTLQALETLAVVAYKQPVTSPEISEIRGVDSGGVLGSLIARKLITTAGRKQVIGRPILYKTTKEFLLKFGLKDVAELPSIEEFEKIAGEMAEQEEIPMAEAELKQSPENEAEVEEYEARQQQHPPQADGDSSPADNVSDETGDKASVDGRISSLPPNYDEAEDDPSAAEAQIQEEQKS